MKSRFRTDTARFHTRQLEENHTRSVTETYGIIQGGTAPFQISERTAEDQVPGARDRQLRAAPLKRAQRGRLDDMRMPHRCAQLEDHGPATCRWTRKLQRVEAFSTLA